MSENALACPKCGAKISADAPQGLCPKCLLQQASFPTEATGSGTRFRPEPPSIEVLGAAFPQLEIVGLIGRGGMGFVFKARQPKLDRLVALKILAESLSADPSFSERFTREGRALARLSHPNIVMIHDFGQAGPFFYLLMEFIDGVNLRQAMQARQITPSEALAIVPKICEALQYAHGEGILHRDIKPDNILLDTKGRVKIADFGIAKLLNEASGESSLTGSGATLGTVHYMAPEQIERPNDVDHRADIYSVGVVFYEMLTGELPIGRFPAPSEKKAVDPRLDKVVFKTLAKEPARRQQSASELGTEVQTIGQHTERIGLKSRWARFAPRRDRAARAVTFCLVFVAAVVLGARLFRHRDAVTGFQPLNSVTNGLYLPPIGAEGQPSITFFFAEGNSQRITLDSHTDLGPEVVVKPVISYNHGPWGGGPATTSDNYSIDRDGPNRQFTGAYYWSLPKDFATAFAVSAEVQRVSATMLNSPLPLMEGTVLELFSISNKDGQTVSGGLEYERRVRDEKGAKNDVAILENFRPSTGEGIGGSYVAKIPDNYRLEAFWTIDDEPKQGSVTWRSDQNRVAVRWPFESQHAYLMNITARMQEGAPLKISPNGPVEAFVLTPVPNVPGVRNPLAEFRTNVIRGMLQLIPSPVSTNATL